MSQSDRDILVLKFGDLASFVDALPAMRAIRRHHRGARVVLITAPPYDALGRDTPYVDDVVTVMDNDDPKEFARQAQLLKKEGVALVYDLENGPLTEKIFNAMKPFPPPWNATHRGVKYRYPPDDARAQDRVDALLAQVAVAGAPAPDDTNPDAAWAATARRGAPSLKPAFFGLESPYVLLLPAAPKEGGPPRWPTARFAGLAARLAAKGVGVALASGPEDRGEARAVASACPQAKDLAARADLTQIAALATEAAGVFGHADEGLLRLCAAAGAPTLALDVSHEHALKSGVRGRQVVHLAAPQPSEMPVAQVDGLIAMFLGVKQSKDERASV